MNHEMTNSSVDAILMASGFSSRFGTGNKLLAPYKGEALALHVLRLVCGMPQFSNVFFVYAADEVGALADSLRAAAIKNTNPGLGIRESIRLGVSASAAGYYAFFPCDTPLLNRAAVAAVLDKRTPGKIIFPESGGHPGNPAVFCATFRPELLALKEGEEAKIIKQRHAQSLVAVPIQNPEILADIDTVHDLSALGK